MLLSRRCSIALLCCFISCTAQALGNHPEAGTCPDDKPYFTFCSNSLHSLEGWVGHCYATREEAQQEADKHVQQEHAGNSRWTAVLKARFSTKYAP